MLLTLSPPMRVPSSSWRTMRMEWLSMRRDVLDLRQLGIL